MSDELKVKIQTHGPGFWQITVADAESGKILPVAWNEGHGITLREWNGVIVADVSLVVHEIDAEAAIARIEEVVEPVTPEGADALEAANANYGTGFIVRRLLPATETVDDFAAGIARAVVDRDA